MIRFQKAARLIAFSAIVIGASLAIANAAGVRNEIIDEPDTGNLFEPIRSVVQHPRCMNCHVIDGIPRQYDDSLPHQQNVHGGPAGTGVASLPCSSCHQATNAPAAAGPNAPPGAPNWHLAPKEMFWVGATSRDICLRLRDPKTNGGKNFEELLHHFADDPLVAWGWNPGGNRTVPPLTQEQTAAAVKKWLDAGAPCPAE